VERIVVVGTSGSGKTTLAQQLATCLNYPHIELDSLYWGENWTESPDFLENVAQEVKQPFWVLDGNYSRTRDIIWPQADTIIWLDYSIWVCYWRMVRRVFQRVFWRVELWNGNRETFREQFLSKESLFVWIYQTHGRRQLKYNQLRHNNVYPHLNWIHHQTPRATKRWLKQICP
jgi:adenylate kinase family enzyme